MSEPQQFVVIGPDEIEIQPEPFASRAAAEDALKKWVERYRRQGYYSTARWERIPVDELAERCRIVDADETLCE